MSQRLPESVNPFRMARGGEAIEGSVAIARMARLVAELQDDRGDARLQGRFLIDEEGRTLFEGRVAARLPVTCQRCLEPVELAIDAPVRVAVAPSDERAEGLAESFEVVVAEESRLALADLIEDELLLALPFAPTHPPGACRAKHENVYEKAREENPFAVLEQLKTR